MNRDGHTGNGKEKRKYDVQIRTMLAVKVKGDRISAYLKGTELVIMNRREDMRTDGRGPMGRSSRNDKWGWGS